MKILPVGAELFHADTRTDGQTYSLSSKFCERTLKATPSANLQVLFPDKTCPLIRPTVSSTQRSNNPRYTPFSPQGSNKRSI